MKEKNNISFRLGTEEDSGLVTQLIYELAEYEKLLDQVTTDEIWIGSSNIWNKDREENS